MLAISYVYCTKLTLKYGHSLFCLPPSAGCPKHIILYVYYDRIWRFGCGLANKIGLHLNREQNDSLSFIILETRAAKVVIRFEVRSFLSRGYFLRYNHLAIPAKLHGPKGDRINESLLYLAEHPLLFQILQLASYSSYNQAKQFCL